MENEEPKVEEVPAETPAEPTPETTEEVPAQENAV